MATKATNKFKDFNSEAQKRYELQAKKETMAEMKRLNDNVRKAMDEASSYRKKQGLGTLKQIKQDLMCVLWQLCNYINCKRKKNELI